MAKKSQERPAETEIELVADEMELVPEEPLELEMQEAPPDKAAPEVVEHEAPAHDEVMVPLEALPDGSMPELVVQSVGVFVVRARESFHDIETKRDYKAGDEVMGWSRERAEKYAQRGLVAIEE